MRIDLSSIIVRLKDKSYNNILKSLAGSLGIKISSAVLSYFMFLFIARAMDAEQYGLFGVAFSLATFLSVFGGRGQRIVVLRYIPVYVHDDRYELRNGIIREGYSVTLITCLIIGAGIVAVGRALDLTSSAYLFAIATLVLVLCLAEYQAHVIRSFGNVVLALAPRDTIWRLGVVLFSIPAATSLTSSLNAVSALWLCALSLALVVIVQAFCFEHTHPLKIFTRKYGLLQKEWRATGLSMWGVAIVVAAAPNLSVVIVGSLMTAVDAGPFFAALKTAALLNLMLLAANMVGAPLISRHFHARELDEVQLLCRVVIIWVSLPTFAAFGTLLLYGSSILSLFGPGFESGYLVLVILSAANMFNVLCGPTADLMLMTGNERKFLVISFVSNSLAMIMIVPLVMLLGTVGAAAAVAFSTVSWNIWVWSWVRTRIGVDPTFMSFFWRVRSPV